MHHSLCVCLKKNCYKNILLVVFCQPLLYNFSSLQSVMNDISIVWRVFSLPILEPMTRSRLQKIVSITMSCLQASIAATIATSIVSVATGSQLKGGSTSKDDEIDGYASIIVQKSVSFLLNFHFNCYFILLHIQISVTGSHTNISAAFPV